MEKFLVISYYEGNINVDVVKNTYEESKKWMDNDVKDFITPTESEEINELDYWIGTHSAFANVDDDRCDWKIESIDV